MTEELEAPAESSPAESAGKRRYKVRFISNGPAEKAAALPEFLRLFTQENFSAEVIEHRIVSKSGGSKRSSSPVFASNACADLYSLRRWASSVLQQPNSVMLLQLGRIKDEPLVVPLVWAELLRQKRSILICNADLMTQRQLQAGIDLQFKQIPPMIEADQPLRESLLERAQRKTGFQSSLRSIGELSFLPLAIREKLNLLRQNQPCAPLNTAETLNLCLLADLCSRYDPTLQAFAEEMHQAEQPISAISALFETLTAEMNPAILIRTLLRFVGEEEQRHVKNKALLCGYIYKHLAECDQSQKKEWRVKRAQFGQVLRELVIQQRVQSDSILFRKCFFLTEQTDVEKILFHSMLPLYIKLQEFVASQEPELALADKVELMTFLVKLAKKGSELDPAPSKEAPPPSPKPGNARQNFAQTLKKPSKDKEAEAPTPENAQLERMVARKVFAQMQLQHFDVFSLWDPTSEVYKLLQTPSVLIRELLNTPVERAEWQAIAQRWRALLFPYEKISQTVQSRVIESIQAIEQEKLGQLEHIYIVHALPEVIHYQFDLGSVNLHALERSCGKTLLESRLGLNVSLQPREDADVRLCASPQSPPLQVLKNAPELIAKAYGALLSNYVSWRVKEFTDHKINHLMKTYKKNFFEILYEFVVVQNNIPLSRQQLVVILRNQNVLANLMDKGWEEGKAQEALDPFLPLEILQGKTEVKLPDEWRNFTNVYPEYFAEFKKLLQSVKQSAESRPEPQNPEVLLWMLFKQGIYNLSSKEAAKAFRKSLFYKQLQDFIAFVSSKYYKDFTGEITSQGVQLFIPRKHGELLMIGMHFGFLVGQKIVRYNLVPFPSSLKELDKLSFLFVNEYEQELQKPSGERERVELIAQMVKAMRRTDRIWTDYSRSLTIGLLDRVLSETTVKMARPGKILPPHLKFWVPDPQKLCLGKALVAGQTSDFSKVLAGTEEMGNVFLNESMNTTTLDEFAIAMHKLNRLRDDLSTLAILSQDILSIVRMLTYSKSEAPFVVKIESLLESLAQLLSKPLRNFGEEDIQKLHETSRQLKGYYYKLHEIRLENQEKRLISKLRDELQARRSDGHLAKINFSDMFILETTQIKVVEKVELDGEQMQQQRKKEVEVQATHQTMPEKIREAIHLHRILRRKRYLIFSPEGQKRKQLEYLQNIVRSVMSLRGSKVQFYVDVTTLDPLQQQEVAKLIKPSHFFRSQELFPEPAPTASSESLSTLPPE